MRNHEPTGFAAPAAALRTLCMGAVFLAAPAALAQESGPPADPQPPGPAAAPSRKFPDLSPEDLAVMGSTGPWRRLDADEMRAALSGKTLHYLYRGASRGEEHHFENGRVVWRMQDGVCLPGVWVAKGETLCYFYDEGSRGCWSMIEGPQGYRHRARDGGMPDVVVRRVSEEPVECAPTPTS